jgi:hypothetical protein
MEGRATSEGYVTADDDNAKKEEAMNYLDDDENVKAMRETARTIGLTQLLIDISRSPAIMGGEDIERLSKVLNLLGVADTEMEPS